MQQHELLQFLTAHADALNVGAEEVQRLLRRYPLLAAETAPLLYLAQQLKQTLVPVVVPAAFREELRAQLTEPQQKRGVGSPGSSRTLWLGAAAVGSLLPVVGLILFWLRRQRTQAFPSAT